MVDEKYEEALAINNAIDISGYSNPETFAESERMVNQLLSLNEFTREHSMNGNSMGRPSFSLTSYATHLKNIQRELSSNGKALDFILSQTALHILNPTLGKGVIANPFTIAFGPPLGFGGLFTDTLDVGLAYNNPTTNTARIEDRLVNLYKGRELEIKIEPSIPPVNIRVNTILSDGSTLEQKLNELNIASPDRPFDRYGPFDQDRNINFQTVNDFGAEGQIPDYSIIFNKQDLGPAFAGGPGGTGFYYPLPSSRAELSEKYARRRGAMSNLDSYFNALDIEQGYVDRLTDLETVVPFYFQDLRRPDRYLYFRTYISSFTENFIPEWNMEKFYGRVDPVATYMNTARTFSITFKIASMSKAGLSTMWKKINNFCKMFYPTFEDGILKAAPVIRLRVGDVVSDGEGLGLPGFITSPQINYSEATWEISEFDGPGTIETGKAPMFADIVFNFQVIHEKSPHLDANYNFDTRYFRRMGTLVNDTNERNNQAQTDSTEGEDQ